MYLTVKQQLNHLSKADFKTLRELSHIAKNLMNQAIYNVRQYYFAEKKYLRYEKNYALLKSSENYRLLNSNMAQQILKEADGCFRSFFGLMHKSENGEYDREKCKLPHYLPKDGFTTLVIGFVRLNGNQLILPFSNTFRKTHKPVRITLPPVLLDKKIKEIRIIPKADARFFEIQYCYEAECVQRKLNSSNALAIDMGINNLVTAVTSTGRTFIIDGKRLKAVNQWYNIIIDGKRLKAVNQWYNKENARLQSIKDKQNFGKGLTRRQAELARYRNNRVNDYMSKTARKVIDYCIQSDIGTLVVGYNKGFKNSTDLGKKNNQNFVNIPFGKLCSKLKYLCQMNGITYVEQEESYTSRASFFDKDDIPVYDQNKTKTYTFSGTRVHRGMYKTKAGNVINADINGALNIMRKSNVVSLTALYNRGEVDTPVRIRIA